jgi:DNA-directed RNA polymerase specialized sigma24 family protein
MKDSRQQPDINGFDLLLKSLHPNREKAAGNYEVLRLKIVSFLRWNGIETAEEDADVVFDRLLQRLQSGAVIHNLTSYALVTARHLLPEIRSGQRRLNAALNDPTYRQSYVEPSYTGESVEPTLHERKSNCLRICLRGLSPSERRLILSYHQQKGQSNKLRRKSIAQKLGIDQNALRLRVHRIRLKLSRCIQGCTEQDKKTEIEYGTLALIKRHK